MRRVFSIVAIFSILCAPHSAFCQEKIQLLGHEEKAYLSDIAFSPDGELLASSARDGSVLVWNGNTGALIKSLKHSEGIDHFEFSPDGRQLAASQDRPTRKPGSDEAVDSVQFWDTTTWEKKELLFVGKSGCRVLFAYLPGGDLVTCFEIQSLGDSKLQRWSPDGKQVQPEFVAKKRFFSTLTVSPDGKWLVGSSTPSMLWSTDDLRRPRVIKDAPITKGAVPGFKFSTDSEFLAGCAMEGERNDSPSRVVLWTVKDMREVGSLPGFLGASVISFSRDGRYLAASAVMPGWWGEVYGEKMQVWDLKSGGQRLLEENTHARQVSFSPTADVMASSFSTPRPGIRFWNSTAGQVIKTFDYGEPRRNVIMKLIYSAKGDRIATWAAHSDGYDQLCLWTVSE